MVDFATVLQPLSNAAKCLFYENLAHQFTVAIRAIWSEDGVSDAEKLRRIIGINEILHRVTAKVTYQRLGLEWADTDVNDTVRDTVTELPAIAADVDRAVRSALGIAQRG